MTAHYAIILCGGSGTRLWPLSRAQRPKQLLPMNGKETLLQQTAMRLSANVIPENLIVITHNDHRFEVKGQLIETFPEHKLRVLSEPCARNTLPAIAWGVKTIWQQSPDALVSVFPSDHAIDNQPAFLSAWQMAEAVADTGLLTLLGIRPSSPAVGYGYIQPDSLLASYTNDNPAYQVKRFVEKPDAVTAGRFVEKGYLWNSGMFVFRADVFMQLLETLQPKMYQTLMAMPEKPDIAEYEQFENISMDYGLVEKASQTAVVPADMDWSDLGSWEAIYQKRPRSEQDNVTVGDVVCEDTQNSLIWATDGMVATLGVDNLVIIQTTDAILVCDRSRTEDLKQLVSKVQLNHPHLADLHTEVHRPWGTYTVLEESEHFKIKRIEVKPGEKLSMQMHEHRAEHWVVISGRARITNGDRDLILEENESTYIPKTHRHRLENAGEQPLVIIEVQCGEYVGEDDIVRFQDIYGRLQ